jgi:transposase
VAVRYEQFAEAGLIDGRCDNGSTKVDEVCYIVLYQLLEHGPPDYGWARPTWTLELLARETSRQTGIRLCRETVRRILKHLGARRGRPRPFVVCPWSKQRRQRRLRQIQQLIDTLPNDEQAFWEDEVDIDLNPKIGPDWMLPGRQKAVQTPGVNAKRYLAGALDAQTGEVQWVESDHKNSLLFIQLIRHLAEKHPKAKRIHLITDNYSIHTSRITQKAIESYQGRIQLHFLPPYDPNDNRIEQLWLDLHANVTRNHRCSDMAALIREVRRYLRAASPFPGSRPSLRKVA